MTDKLASSCYQELCVYSGKRNGILPPWGWSLQQIFRTLLQYPSGMSRSVLLTEVDSKWIAALKRGENAGRLKQVIATSQISKSDILEGEFYLIDEFRCRLSSEGASSIFILHRQYKDWISFCRNNIDGLGKDVKRLKGAFANCRLLKASSQPLVILPSASEISPETASSSLLSEYTFVKRTLMRMHQEYLANPIKQDDNERFGFLGQVQGISRILPYPGAHNSSPQLYRTILFSLPEGIPAPFSFDMSAGGSRIVLTASRHFYMVLYDDQAFVGDLLEEGDWTFVYRPCLAPHIEELCIFGSAGNVPPGQTGAGRSMAYDVVYRADDHILTYLGDTHHLLFGTVSMVIKIVGLEDHIDMPRLPKKGSDEDAGTCGGYAQSLQTSNYEDMSRSVSPVNVCSLVHGAKHVSLLGRVLSLQWEVALDVTESTSTLIVFLYLLPCQSLHGGNESATSSLCLISCSVTAALASTSTNSANPPTTDARRFKMLMKPGQQIFLSELTAIDIAEACADSTLLTINLPSGPMLVSRCFSLAPSALSGVMSLDREYALPGSPEFVLYQKALFVENASPGISLPVHAINLSRVVALSTSPGILAPVSVAQLLRERDMNSSTVGAVAVYAAICGEWDIDLLDCRRASDEQGGGKRRRLSVEITEAIQMITLGTGMGDSGGHGTVHCFLTRDTICTSSSVNFNGATGIRIGTAQSRNGFSPEMMASHDQRLTQRYVFVLSEICECAGPKRNIPVYRIEAIADENIIAMTKIAQC